MPIRPCQVARLTGRSTIIPFASTATNLGHPRGLRSVADCVSECITGRNGMSSGKSHPPPTYCGVTRWMASIVTAHSKTGQVLGASCVGR